MPSEICSDIIAMCFSYCLQNRRRALNIAFVMYTIRVHYIDITSEFSLRFSSPFTLLN